MELAELLQMREEDDRAWFGRLHRRWEKTWEDPNDVLLEAKHLLEKRRKAAAKKRRKQGRGAGSKAYERSLQALQQIDDPHSTGIRYGPHGLQGDVPLAPLDGSHIRPVNAGMMRKFILGPTLGLPQFPHVLSKPLLILHLLAVWGYSGFVPTVYKQRSQRAPGPTGPKYTHTQHDLRRLSTHCACSRRFRAA